MTISNLGSVAATQPNWQARKADKPDATGAGVKTGTHHRPHSGATSQPSLSDSLQSLLLGTQSTQAADATQGAARKTTAQGTTAQGTTAQETTALQPHLQTLTKALAAYGGA